VIATNRPALLRALEWTANATLHEPLPVSAALVLAAGCDEGQIDLPRYVGAVENSIPSDPAHVAKLLSLLDAVPEFERGIERLASTNQSWQLLRDALPRLRAACENGFDQTGVNLTFFAYQKVIEELRKLHHAHEHGKGRAAARASVGRIA
jgi:hypothetical protein